jgi:hypothetical protein
MLNKYYKLITKKCDIFTGISYFFNIGIPIDTCILKEHLHSISQNNTLKFNT